MTTLNVGYTRLCVQCGARWQMVATPLRNASLRCPRCGGRLTQPRHTLHLRKGDSVMFKPIGELRPVCRWRKHVWEASSYAVYASGVYQIFACAKCGRLRAKKL